MKLGDKVRVVRHRNAWGEDIPTGANLNIGDVIEVTEWDEEASEWGEVAGWRAFTSKDVTAVWFRTDDVELVTEQGPVRTVTRREIVSGQYGIVDVSSGQVGVDLGYYTADELRAAAATLTELADYLSTENERND